MDDVKVLPLGLTPLVLVVDDERTPRAIVTRMVRSLGYRALGCENGRPALQPSQEPPWPRSTAPRGSADAGHGRG